MGKTFNYERAEQEANKIGLEFAHSNDVVKDMSRAYNVDFSNIRVHTDSAADNKVKAAGKDALAQGNDIFFGKGIFESSDPADKGLVAHEFAHTMQQGTAMGGEMAVAESAPMGMAQGGLGSWFKRHFTHKGRVARRAEKAPMADMNAALNSIFAGEGETPQMAAGVTPVRTVSHEEFQQGKNELALRGLMEGTWAPPQDSEAMDDLRLQQKLGVFNQDASADPSHVRRSRKKSIRGWKDGDIAWWL